MAVIGTTVPEVPPWIGYEGVLSGRPVRGGDAQWRSYGAVLNHLLGRGGTLIPHARCNTLLEQNTTQTLRFYVAPRAQTVQRLWTMTYGITSALAECLVRFTDPSGGTSDATLRAGSGGTTLTHYHLEDVADPAAADLAPTWQEVNDIGNPTLLWVSCFEMPRPEVPTAHGGVILDLLGQGRSIYTTTGVGPGAIVDGVETAWTAAPRNGLYHFARGQTDYLSTTSGVRVDVFASGSFPIIRARRETPTSTTKTVSARIRASSGAGTTGTVWMTMASGGAATFSITSGMAEAWVDNDIDVAVDDLSTSTGFGTTDTCRLEWQRTGGANAINIHAIAVNNG